MELYTIQLSKWRIALNQNIPLLDTTVKSGDATFAPTWEIVMGIKQGLLTPEAYSTQYASLMRQSYLINTARWLDVLSMDRVAIACYCPANCFCHRLLLKDYFQKVCDKKNLPFTYSGELV